MLDPSTTRLSLRDVDLRATGTHDASLENVSLDVGAGELVLVHLDKRHARVPLLDAALGLRNPDRGKVAIEGRLWSTMTVREAAQARSHIGCIFDRAEWIANLEVDKNILLAQQHHTAISDAELRQSAEVLARHFGLEELPRERPHSVPEQLLRRAACVRALLGSPRLLVLERPTRDVCLDLAEPLMVAMEPLREQGTAVLWTTTSDWVMEQFQDQASRVQYSSGGQLVPGSIALEKTP